MAVDEGVHIGAIYRENSAVNPPCCSFHIGTLNDAGHLMVVALANFDGLQTVAYYTLKNLYQPGDTIHTTYVEDSAGAGVHTCMCIVSGFCNWLLDTLS